MLQIFKKIKTCPGPLFSNKIANWTLFYSLLCKLKWYVKVVNYSLSPIYYKSFLIIKIFDVNPHRKLPWCYPFFGQLTAIEITWNDQLDSWLPEKLWVGYWKISILSLYSCRFDNENEGCKRWICVLLWRVNQFDYQNRNWKII